MGETDYPDVLLADLTCLLGELPALLRFIPGGLCERKVRSHSSAHVVRILIAFIRRLMTAAPLNARRARLRTAVHC